MFENKKDKVHDVHYSRYIMSYIRSGGVLSKRGEGRETLNQWLVTLELDEEDIDNILDMATTGRMELESSAYNFLRAVKTNVDSY
jgi:hypothetical protein